MSYTAPAVPPMPAPMAALLPTLEWVAAPMPAPAAPPRVAPVNVAQPVAPKTSNDNPRSVGLIRFVKMVIMEHLLHELISRKFRSRGKNLVFSSQFARAQTSFQDKSSSEKF